MNRSSADETGDSPLQRNLWRAIGLLKVVEFDHFERMDNTYAVKRDFLYCSAFNQGAGRNTQKSCLFVEKKAQPIQS
jgi:hypothetical protein